MNEDQAAARYLQMAVELAVNNVREGKGGPFGAVLVHGDHEKVWWGANEVTALNDPTAHAEIQVIREGARSLQSFSLESCTLYASCEPCPMCLGAIYWARIRAVVYAATRQDAAAAGFDDALIYTEIPLAPELRKLPMRRVERSNAGLPFEEWAQSSARVKY